MAARIRVGVIFGGRSGEHEVSLVSATSVIGALDKEKYEIVPIGIAHTGRWLSSGNALQLLKSGEGLDREPERFLVPEPNRRGLLTINNTAEVSQGLDVVFPVLHGTYGEDGTIQGLLELANIPYVGAGVLGSALGMDKIVQKQLFQHARIPCPRYVWFLSNECGARPKSVVTRVEKSLRYPVFTKPANTGSSVGISKAHNRRELLAGLEDAAQYDRKVIVEQGIRNVREIECSVLGNDDPVASVPGEIISSNEFYDYDAKYVDGKSTPVIPARLPQRTAREIQRRAIMVFKVLNCCGMARVDFFVSKRSGRVYVNELNTIPGFTSISMYPKLWEASGLSYSQLLDRLIALALQRHREKNFLKTSFHPKAPWYSS